MSSFCPAPEQTDEIKLAEGICDKMVIEANILFEFLFQMLNERALRALDLQSKQPTTALAIKLRDGLWMFGGIS